jgi:hypothetical protein
VLSSLLYLHRSSLPYAAVTSSESVVLQLQDHVAKRDLKPGTYDKTMHALNMNCANVRSSGEPCGRRGRQDRLLNLMTCLRSLHLLLLMLNQPISTIVPPRRMVIIAMIAWNIRQAMGRPIPCAAARIPARQVTHARLSLLHFLTLAWRPSRYHLVEVGTI